MSMSLICSPPHSKHFDKRLNWLSVSEGKPMKRRATGRSEASDFQDLICGMILKQVCQP